MFVITEIERKQALDHSDNFADMLVKNEAGPVFYKIISNLVSLTTPIKDIPFNEKMLRDPEMQENFKKMIYIMVQVASEAQDQVFYTTGELAKYFGVSITSINKWIVGGRFVGIIKENRNKHARVSENTLWVSSSGKTIPIKEIVSMWEEENNRRCLIEVDYQDEIEKEIKWFEDKFGGTLEDTLKKKENKTLEEETYQEQWEYLLQYLQRYGHPCRPPQ